MTNFIIPMILAMEYYEFKCPCCDYQLYTLVRGMGYKCSKCGQVVYHKDVKE